MRDVLRLMRSIAFVLLTEQLDALMNFRCYLDHLCKAIELQQRVRRLVQQTLRLEPTRQKLFQLFWLRFAVLLVPEYFA